MINLITNVFDVFSNFCVRSFSDQTKKVRQLSKNIESSAKKTTFFQNGQTILVYRNLSSNPKTATPISMPSKSILKVRPEAALFSEAPTVYSDTNIRYDKLMERLVEEEEYETLVKMAQEKGIINLSSEDQKKLSFLKPKHQERLAEQEALEKERKRFNRLRNIWVLARTPAEQEEYRVLLSKRQRSQGNENPRKKRILEWKIEEAYLQELEKKDEKPPKVNKVQFNSEEERAVYNINAEVINSIRFVEEGIPLTGRIRKKDTQNPKGRAFKINRRI